MTRFILASLIAASAALFWSSPASAHGCHKGWQQAAAQGWHSHGAKCDTRHGLGVTQRSKQRVKRGAS
jgi:hypothetical protein